MEIKTDYSDIKFKDNGKLKLLIIVGTRPEIIRLAAKQDYDAFYNTEIRMRRLMIYPPFCDICVVGFSGADEVKTRVASQRTLDKIKELTAGEYKDEKLIVLGPLPARVPRVNKKYRYRLIIKCRNTKGFRSMISEILKDFSTANFQMSPSMPT